MDRLKAIFWHLAALPLTVLMHALSAIDAIAEEPDARAIAAVLLVVLIVLICLLMGWTGDWQGAQ